MSEEEAVSTTEGEAPDMTPTERFKKHWSEFVWWLVGIMFAALAVMIGLYFYVDASAASDCKRTVDARDDNRAMWLYLIENADPEDKTVPSFTAELNSRLPALYCDEENKPQEL